MKVHWMYGSDLKMFQRKVSGLLFVSSHCLLTHVDLVRVERDAVAVQPVQVPRLGQQVESEQRSVMIKSRLESGFHFTAGRLSARILAEETHCCIVHRISPLLLLSPRLI